jgi:cobaltochelatase CobS
VVVTGRRDAEPADVFGKIHLVEGSTKFLPGLLVQAYEAGWAIIIDEIDSFPPEVGLSLHRMLEKKPLVLEDGQLVTPAARSLIIATANTRGDGEGGDAYTGTSVFNLATLNRFEKWVVTYPAPDVEEKILVSHLPTLDPVAIKAMVLTATDIRNSYQQGSCPGPISIRDLIRWGKKITLSSARTDVQPVYHAFDKAFGNGVDHNVRAMLHKLVQTHFNVQAPPVPQF